MRHACKLSVELVSSCTSNALYRAGLLEKYTTERLHLQLLRYRCTTICRRTRPCRTTSVLLVDLASRAEEKTYSRADCCTLKPQRHTRLYLCSDISRVRRRPREIKIKCNCGTIYAPHVGTCCRRGSCGKLGVEGWACCG